MKEDNLLLRQKQAVEYSLNRVKASIEALIREAATLEAESSAYSRKAFALSDKSRILEEEAQNLHNVERTLHTLLNSTSTPTGTNPPA